jgi:general secretion pathway protein A
MYESYWQLDAKPFEHSADTRFHYPTQIQHGAQLKLRYAIENRRSAALLAGASGLGKTLVAHSLLAHLAEPFSPRVHLFFPQLAPEQLVHYLADQVTGQRAPRETIEQSVRRLEQFLSDNTAAGRHAVVVIDEAHLLAETGGLQTLRLLLNLEVGSQPAATYLLVGQTGLMVAIDRMPEFEERMAVKCLLRRLSLEETMAYVQHRLSAAGARRPIFSDAALEAVHELSQGVPRRINRLCDLALVVGFAEESPRLERVQIEAVAEELLGAATS